MAYKYFILIILSYYVLGCETASTDQRSPNQPATTTARNNTAKVCNAFSNQDLLILTGVHLNSKGKHNITGYNGSAEINCSAPPIISLTDAVPDGCDMMADFTVEQATLEAKPDKGYAFEKWSSHPELGFCPESCLNQTEPGPCNIAKSSLTEKADAAGFVYCLASFKEEEKEEDPPKDENPPKDDTSPNIKVTFVSGAEGGKYGTILAPGLLSLEKYGCNEYTDAKKVSTTINLPGFEPQLLETFAWPDIDPEDFKENKTCTQIMPNDIKVLGICDLKKFGDAFASGKEYYYYGKLLNSKKQEITDQERIDYHVDILRERRKADCLGVWQDP